MSGKKGGVLHQFAERDLNKKRTSSNRARVVLVMRFIHRSLELLTIVRNFDSTDV